MEKYNEFITNNNLAYVDPALQLSARKAHFKCTENTL